MDLILTLLVIFFLATPIFLATSLYIIFMLKKEEEELKEELKNGRQEKKEYWENFRLLKYQYEDAINYCAKFIPLEEIEDIKKNIDIVSPNSPAYTYPLDSDGICRGSVLKTFPAKITEDEKNLTYKAIVAGKLYGYFFDDEFDKKYTAYKLPASESIVYFSATSSCKEPIYFKLEKEPQK